MYKKYRSASPPPACRTVAKDGENVQDKLPSDNGENLANEENPEDDFLSSTEVTSEICQAWRAIEQTVSKENLATSGNQLLKKSGAGWSSVRLFVSSTFTDFHNERELLVKKVKYSHQGNQCLSLSSDLKANIF